jgi:hypothetical protein
MDSIAGSGSGPVDSAAIGILLREKRKTRSQKACLPCHLRKVKCDHQTPCGRCVERDHLELCTYDLPSKRPRNWDGTSPQAQEARSLHPDQKVNDDNATLPPSQDAWAEVRAMIQSLNDSVIQLRRELRSVVQHNNSGASSVFGSERPDTAFQDQSNTSPDLGAVQYDVHGMAASTTLTEEQIYIGGNSVPAMFMALSQEDRESNDAVRDLLSKSVLPIFGLDNESATYPFVDLWGIPHGSTRRVELLYSVVPTDAECHQIFRHYHDIAHVIFPVVGDVNQFEGSLTDFLNDRRQGQSFQQTDFIVSKDIHWLGLLFAILASGLQCSDLARKERVAKSQVYGE